MVTVYQCSDGSYYGDAQVWQRLESGQWTPCCWDADTGREWVENEAEELLLLEPVARSELPVGVQTESASTGTLVRDDRLDPVEC